MQDYRGGPYYVVAACIGTGLILSAFFLRETRPQIIDFKISQSIYTNTAKASHMQNKEETNVYENRIENKMENEDRNKSENRVESGVENGGGNDSESVEILRPEEIDESVQPLLIRPKATISWPSGRKRDIHVFHMAFVETSFLNVSLVTICFAGV